jgi:hypothetical protein
MLASPRGLSQLATSFIAYLRQGIHTHALSSLTIKFTLDTEFFASAPTPYIDLTAWLQLVLPINIQLSKIAGSFQPSAVSSQLVRLNADC